MKKLKWFPSGYKAQYGQYVLRVNNCGPKGWKWVIVERGLFVVTFYKNYARTKLRAFADAQKALKDILLKNKKG